MLWIAADSWGIISSTIGKITCEKCPKSRLGEEVKKKITPTIRCCEQHLMVGHIACSTIGKIICEKCPNSRMGEEVKKKKKTQPSDAVHSTW